MSMNQPLPTRPLPLPRATTPQQPFQPQQPPQPPQPPPQQQPYRQQRPQQQAAEAGTDPAAVIAARSAAVARNRQHEARMSMLQDVLRIVFVGVLIGGIVWVVFWRHRHHMEEERLRVEAEQRAQEERAKEQREREERFAAERKEQQQKKEAAEAEKQRKEEEKRRLADEQKKANRQRVENVKRHADAMRLFRGTTLDLLSVAPKGDLPETVTVETWFSCVVPSGRRGPTLYEMKALPGKDIHVTRLDEEGNAADISFDELNNLLKKTSFLLAKGTRCYYRPSNLNKWSVPVPAGNQRVDLAKEDFGRLYEIVKNCDRNAAHLSYEVTFEDAGGVQTRLADVPFGDQVSQADVVRGLDEADSSMGRNARGVNRKRLSDGKLIFRRKGRSR